MSRILAPWAIEYVDDTIFGGYELFPKPLLCTAFLVFYEGCPIMTQALALSSG